MKTGQSRAKKEKQKTGVGENVKKSEFLDTINGKVNWTQLLLKIAGQFLKQYEIKLSLDLRNPLQGLYPRQIKSGYCRDDLYSSS